MESIDKNRPGIEARLYSAGEDKSVNCNLCSFRCHILPGKRGICGVRENQEGRLITLVYGHLIAANPDPIEKKPLFHFQPGTRSYSIATVGCNFNCLHCQNYAISQISKEKGHRKPQIAGKLVSPTQVIDSAKTEQCASISYTYTEPTIFFEFAEDTALLAQRAGLKNAFVTNGYMTNECLQKMSGLIDAANVDLKSFDDNTYKRLCGARLSPVLKSIERMRELGIWVEVTTLVIPTVNDSEAELKSIARWLAKIDKNMPWHISAFYPTYKLTEAPPTPVETLVRAREIGLSEGLRYVYTGNIPCDEGESTFCYDCNRLLIKRYGFKVLENVIEDSKCPTCKTKIHGYEIDPSPEKAPPSD